ncbi:phosphoenolpyruvate--protein phosphotransferase [Brevibacillus dissolubilis]|uniref:phosphoenolpyruvate--protein phosphotransferase n=1 Tax=Brevibacillus dissolubilis TaxID=1844116 RepID=UPI00111702E8|nr:phosphoenolpyruvate--protein phosphotransferase [Brevibacillus dissolubilis]
MTKLSVQKRGIAASPGIAIGKAFVLRDELPAINRVSISAEQVETELGRLCLGLDKTGEQLRKLRESTAAKMGEEQAKIFDAHLLLLQDPELIGGFEGQIKDSHQNAESAVQDTTEGFAAIFASLDDEYMRERASDIRDIGSRLIKNIAGVNTVSLAEIEEEVVVLAHDLTPSDTAQLNSYVLGFAAEIGGRTSHSAIMARSLDLPAVVGGGTILEVVAEGDLVIVDGFTGDLIINPNDETLRAYTERRDAYLQERETLRQLISAESNTQDGVHIELAANIGTPKDAVKAMENGADAIGLYRTEFLYMDRTEMPTEEEQFEAYRAVAQTMKGRPVIIRTLDIGGDKELPYLQLPHEANPFLGYRAIRLCLDQTDLFKRQLRAILRASAFGELLIMFPMISNLQELRAAKALLHEARQELSDANIAFDSELKVGMMVEIPSAAILADVFAKEVDFFSIGTNDLVQYTLAVDRMNEKIAPLYQPFHPAILRLIKSVADAAKNNGIFAGMCGEMAGDPVAMPLLVGLGLTELSMSAPSILPARKALQQINYAEAKVWAEEALTLATAEEVREFVLSKLGQLTQ